MCFCIRYIAFSLNFIYFILGGVTVGLGIWVLIDLPDFAKFFGYGAIVGGGIVIVSSCLGFVGTTCTSKSLLVLYMISLVAVIALQSYVTYECFTLNPTRLEEAVYEGLDKSFKTGHRKVYHNLEKTVKCCGVNKTEGGDYPTGHLPKLCCIMVDPEGKTCKQHHIWPGCTKVVTDRVLEFALPFAYGLIGSCTVQILMILSACILITYPRPSQEHFHISH